MSIRIALAVVVFGSGSLAMLCSGGHAQQPEGTDAERVKIVRQTYEKVPPTILKIKEPIRVVQCSHQKVPVVITLMFTDADGINYTASWWRDKGKFSNREYDRIYWVRYKGLSSVGEKHYVLPIRGPEEDALYGLLLRYKADQEKKKELPLFEQTMLKNVSLLLDKLDPRFAGEKPALTK